ncbi:MAG: hypothetical protein AAFP03_12080, partial [Cyanobacteria bacterium J06598_3]
MVTTSSIDSASTPEPASPKSQEQAEATAKEAIQERALQLKQIAENLRPGQRSLAQWQSGPLAVSAVPGS